MIGSIIGDIAGSYWEFRDEKNRDSDLFLPESSITDDSVLSIATAEAIMTNQFYSGHYQKFFRHYKDFGYGPAFAMWAGSNSNYISESFSYGNGAAMRVGPVGWAFNTPQQVLMEAQQSACITHCHPAGIAGAQSIALAVFLARKGGTKEEIAEAMDLIFNYDVHMDLNHLHETYTFDPSCQGTVPPAIACVLQANSFEEALRNGLYIGGDTDTLMCIAGSIAEPLFGVPDHLRAKAEAVLASHSNSLLGIVKDFEKKYGCGKGIATAPEVNEFKFLDEEPTGFKYLLEMLKKFRTLGQG